MNKTITILFLLIAANILLSCNEKATPKPKTFARIDRMDSSKGRYIGDKFSFDYSNEGVIELLPANDKSEIWLNIRYPVYNATIHCSYIPINGVSKFESLLEDSYHLAFSHASKANSIKQDVIENVRQKSTGIIYIIDGSVATPVQFFVTDSTSNFLRGSLYYDRVVNPDSVASVTSFIKNDIQSLIESIQWNK